MGRVSIVPTPTLIGRLHETFDGGRTLLTFSHPDCDCRPRISTGSMDSVHSRALTAGGDFHPAPKVASFHILRENPGLSMGFAGAREAVVGGMLRPYGRIDGMTAPIHFPTASDQR
jgi:hypothetical protein